MSFQYRIITPFDIVNFRGNASFGESGEYGFSVMPPQPSIFAGAIRSNWLAQEKVDLHKFQQSSITLTPALKQQLGTPTAPGEFRIGRIMLVKTYPKSGEIADYYMPVPNDLVIHETDIHFLQPSKLPEALQSSVTTDFTALLQAKAGKPKSGMWLTDSGIQRWMLGDSISSQDLVSSSELWDTDERIGIGMQMNTRTVEEGQLYGSQSICLHNDISFLAAITGAPDLPEKGVLRLGGDGKAAQMSKAEPKVVEPDWDQIESSRAFRLVLTTPALFSNGWVPSDGFNVELADGSAYLCCSASSRADVISGWDLANWRPKTAQRTLPAGSVFWFDNYTGSLAALKNLLVTGFCCEQLGEHRKAEGYNNILIANWNK